MKTKLLRRVRKLFKLRVDEDYRSGIGWTSLVIMDIKTKEIKTYHIGCSYEYYGECNQFIRFIIDNRRKLGVSSDEIRVHNLNKAIIRKRTLLNKKYKHLFS